MLKKIVAIKNVGKFKRYAAAGDVAFATATLIYAPNGRGKTTLCDVFRSLKSGDGECILGRETLGSVTPPEVEILLESGLARFKHGLWSTTLPELEVYDSRFIYENVYAGECVEHEQRRNLYGVIIGEQGVALQRKVDELADEGRESGRAVNEKERAVSALIQGKGITVDIFMSLEEESNVDAKIKEARKLVMAQEKASELQSKAALSKLTVPAFPKGLDSLLDKSLDDVSEDAEEAIREHMEAHMAEPDEQWLVRGVGLIAEEACPFCAQPLSASELLAAYKSHFAGEYRELKNEISQWFRQAKAFAQQEVALRLERTVNDNNLALADWEKYVSVSAKPELKVAQVQRALVGLWQEAVAVLEQKSRAPLERLGAGDDLHNAREDAAAAHALVDAYNEQVSVVNEVLRAKKEEAKSGDPLKARRELAALNAAKTRHTDEAKSACTEFGKARLKRKELELKKEEAKIELEEYSRDIFQRYQARINRLLENFGATFRIGNTGERYKGGKPSSTYSLVIENVEVNLGDSKTPLSKPSFKNTLSAGDKSALALAFFLAVLDQSVDLASKVVVLDDPFTSQDASRQTCTQQEIRRLAREAKQVVVLSHDRRFLKRVWDGLDSGFVKTLQFAQLRETVITEWDIKSVQDEYVSLFTTLWKFCNRNEGDAAAAVKTIRPLLEGYLRMKLPHEFAEDKWLGDYVKQIREADPSSIVGQAQGHFLDELTDLKDYSKKHHHPPGSDAPDEPVVDDEVLAFGRRALRLVQAF